LNIRNKKQKRNRNIITQAVKLFVKKGDTVVVLSGKDKGKKGVVLRAFPKMNKVLVEGVNMATVYEKVSRGKAGGILKHEMPIHASNVKVATKGEKKVITKAKKEAKKETPEEAQ